MKRFKRILSYSNRRIFHIASCLQTGIPTLVLLDKDGTILVRTFDKDEVNKS